jgi:hypothetical protein
MSVVVQTGTGNLSTMTWYEAVSSSNLFPLNTGASGTGMFSISGTTRYIDFTPSSAGNLKGVVLALVITDAANVSAASITVKLQENTGSWVDRLSVTLTASDFMPSVGGYYKIGSLVDFRFASTYAITTASNTWRIAISATITGANAYVRSSQNGNEDYIFFVPYIDNTVAIGTSAAVITDQLTVDQNWTISSHDAQTGAQSGMDEYVRYYSVYMCTPILTGGSTTNPQIYVPPTIASNISLQFDGLYYLSDWNIAQFKVGDSSTTPIPSNRTVDIYFANVSSNHKGMFINSHEVRFSYNSGIQIYGNVPTRISADLAVAAAATDTSIYVKGDVTSDWAVNDYIEIGGGGSNTAPVRNYFRSEYRQINSAMTYSAGTDRTTIPLNTALSQQHSLHADVETKVTLVTRNVKLRTSNSSTPTNNMKSYINCGSIKIYGTNLEYFHSFNLVDAYASYLTSAQYSAMTSQIYGCNFHDTYETINLNLHNIPLYMDGCTDSSENTSVTSTIKFSYLYIKTGSSAGCYINNNIFVGKGFHGIYVAGGKNVFIDSNYVNINRLLWVRDAASGIECTNNTIYNCINPYYAYSGSNVYIYNDTIRCVYATSLSDTNGTVIKTFTGYCVDWVAEDLDVKDVGNFIVDDGDMKLDILFSNLVVSNINNYFVDVSNRDTWAEITSIRFEEYQGTSGRAFEYNFDGYQESTGTGLPDTEAHTTGTGKLAWRINPYYTDTAYIRKFTVPINYDNRNKPVTISMWVKFDATNYTAGTHVLPRLTATGAGGGSHVAYAVDTTSNWQFIFLTTTPTRSGSVSLRFIVQTDASSPNNYVYYDDFAIGYQTPVDLGGLDMAIDGRAPNIPISQFSTAAQVWAESLVNMTVPGSAGERLKVLALEATLGTPVALDSGTATVSGMLTKLADDNAGASYDATTDSQRAIASAVDAVPTAAEIDTQLSGTHGSGSWQGTTPADVADAVWDEAKAGHVVAGSFGEEVQSHSTSAEVGTLPTAAEIDTQLSTTHGSGSWEGSTAADIADAVWDELTSGHVTAGTFGKLMQDAKDAVDIAKALVHDNGLLDTMVFDGDKNLTSARLRCYDSNTNAAAAKATSPAGGTTGLLYTFTITATYVNNVQTNFMIVRA